MLRTAFTVAIVPALALIAAPAFAGGASMSREEQAAFARCQLRQPHMQSGKGLIFQPQNCRQIARIETAQYSPKLPLASRGVGID
jgi:hypothetical protein